MSEKVWMHSRPQASGSAILGSAPATSAPASAEQWTQALAADEQGVAYRRMQRRRGLIGFGQKSIERSCPPRPAVRRHKVLNQKDMGPFLQRLGPQIDLAADDILLGLLDLRLFSRRVECEANLGLSIT